MILAFDGVTVNLGVERLAHQTRRSIELNDHFTCGDVINGEPVRFKPSSHRLNVGIRGTEFQPNCAGVSHL